MAVKRAGRRSHQQLVTVEEYAELVSATPDKVREWVGLRQVVAGRDGMVQPPVHGYPPPGYLRVRDFAAINGVSPAWVYYLVSEKRISACRVPTGGGYFRTFIPPWETLDGDGDARTGAAVIEDGISLGNG
jgi:hypothetical protein